MGCLDSSIASDRPNKGVGHEDREEFIGHRYFTFRFSAVQVRFKLFQNTRMWACSIQQS